MVWPTLGSRTAKEQEQELTYLLTSPSQCAACPDLHRESEKTTLAHNFPKRQPIFETLSSTDSMRLGGKFARVGVVEYLNTNSLQIYRR